jgi:hypothetical protein
MAVKSKTTLCLMSILSVFIFAPPQASATPSILNSISASMKKLDREMCRKYPSRKCVKKTKTARPKTMVTAPPPAASRKTSLPPAAAKTITPKFEDRIPATKVIAVGAAHTKKSVPVPHAAPTSTAAGKVALAPVKTPPAKIPVAPESGAEGDCLKALAALGTTFVPVAQPSAKPECHVTNPVRLVSVDVEGSKVKLADEPTLNCTFALKFAGWIQSQAVPLTYSELNAPLARISTGPGFDCRGRNGDSAAKMSEHAAGNAVDIENIQTINSAKIVVKDALDPATSGFGLLKLLRASACKDFTTVLGPGANPAHAEHFHFDLEKRKAAGTYQICQ